MPKTRRAGQPVEPIVTTPQSPPRPAGDGDEPDAAGGGPEPAGYDESTSDELRAELARRGLPTSGRKAELVARLVANDHAQDDDGDDGDDGD